MKSYNNAHAVKAIAMLLIAGTLFSCGGGATAPARKKMPEFNSFDGIEGGAYGTTSGRETQGSFAFAPTNVDMVFDGSLKEFVSIPLPNAANDSAAISLVNSIKPFAMPMIAAWARQQRNGVVLDLSNHTSANVHRTDYVMLKPNEYSIPVIVLWDQASAYRVSAIKNMVEDMPAFRFNRTSGDDPIKVK
ncbi:MAG: hypothetical protein ABIN91_22235 [Mucilaginibacter sp.]|uniref:hypothetical protein n=1 Tax=Mucilaginibacter sp. TaxID=1882438 RepID=UPI003267D891